MQQKHYSAAELTGENDFPSHLTANQVLSLLRSHSVDRAELRDDGAIVATSSGSRLVDGVSVPATFIDIFKPTRDGLFRSARLLLWLGY